MDGMQVEPRTKSLGNHEGRKRWESRRSRLLFRTRKLGSSLQQLEPSARRRRLQRMNRGLTIIDSADRRPEFGPLEPWNGEYCLLSSVGFIPFVGGQDG